MALPDSLILASEVIGFISFAITLLTLVGVYADLIRTLRGAPTTIPIALGNLREEIRYEQRLCHHETHEKDDNFRVFPGKRPGYRGRKDHARLLSETLGYLWREFCDVERKFLIKGEKAWDEEDGNDEGNRFDDNHDDDSKASEAEKRGESRRRSRRRRRKSSSSRNGRNNNINTNTNTNGNRNTRSRPTAIDYNRRQSFIKSRMGWIEAGLSRDRTTYYNTDLAHRFLWWWGKDDVKSLMQQVQRIQIRRIERDSYESNELVKRSLKIYGRTSGYDVFHSSDSSDGGGGGRGGGGRPGSDDGSDRGGYARRSSRKRDTMSASRPGDYRRSNYSHHGDARRGNVREISEREIVRRRAPGAQYTTPSRRSTSAVTKNDTSRRERSRRGSVVYEYEVVNPGRTHVEYGDPRQDPRWQEGRQRSYSRERRDDED